jgi:fibronectin type 3 domain-containing protein
MQAKKISFCGVAATLVLGLALVAWPQSGGTPHSVSLSWTASTSTVVGYNVYRGTTTGGPYTKISAAPVAGTVFTDSSVIAGTTYFYVATAVDSSGNESVNSNEATVTVPKNPNPPSGLKAVGN